MEKRNDGFSSGVTTPTVQKPGAHPPLTPPSLPPPSPLPPHPSPLPPKSDVVKRKSRLLLGSRDALASPLLTRAGSCVDDFADVGKSNTS